jgi:RHS repeat-associated protein
VESRVVSQRESLGSSSGSGSGSGRTFAVLTDPIGTPLALVDPAGDTAWAARLSVWGDGDRSESSTSRTPLRFPGHYHDPETRLHYNRHRYYDPACGRYLTPDPLGLAAAWDQHSYVDNPLADADPLGLAPCVTIRHYTSKDSYQKIMSGGDKDSILLKASNPSCGNPRGVYVTPMSPAELTKKPGGFKSFLGVTREKSEYLIEFKMPADQFAGRLRGGRAHVWFSPGDVRIPKASNTYHGPTANWPG